MEKIPLNIRGRGTAENPASRFEQIRYEPQDGDCPEEQPSPKTQFFRDKSRTFIAYNNSPDIGFDASINPYRGCEHGCGYCYARPTHEYLGFSAGLDFETKIMVKEDGPELLRKELASPRWKPQVVNISGVTDAYQPIERKLQITRRCLEVLADFRNPAVIVTKNHLVTRDLDVLTELHKYHAIAVFISVTTLDGELRRILEPRTSHPQGRLAAVRELSDAGIPVGVMVAPIIPGLNDHEIPTILDAIGEAGADFAKYTMLRLSYGLKDLFAGWLQQHLPDQADKVLGRIRAMRGGKLNDTRFGKRMGGEGVFADVIGQMFKGTCKKYALNEKKFVLSTASFRRSEFEQETLFE